MTKLEFQNIEVQLMSDNHKVAVITGGAQGIGKAIAELFLTNGHDVWGMDREPAAIEAAGYTHIICDIRDYENLPDISNEYSVSWNDDVKYLVIYAKGNIAGFYINGQLISDQFLNGDKWVVDVRFIKEKNAACTARYRGRASDGIWCRGPFGHCR